jgi:hypothetical protein
MRTRCTGNRGSDLPADVLEASRNTPLATFNLIIGNEYTVYAMKLAVYGLSVMVVSGDPPRPYWSPIDLFEVLDGDIPNNWEFTRVAGHHWIRALWGYKSLIHDPAHHDDLINRKIHARDAFLRDCNLSSLEDA